MKKKTKQGTWSTTKKITKIFKNKQKECIIKDNAMSPTQYVRVYAP